MRFWAMGPEALFLGPNTQNHTPKSNRAACKTDDPIQLVHECSAALPRDQPHLFKLQNHLMGAIVNIRAFRLHPQFGIDGNIVGV